MELSYRRSESTVRPQEITFDTNHVRLVRNIEEELREYDDDVILYYTYEEAILTQAEFQMYMSLEIMAPLNTAIRILLGEEQ